MEQHLLFLGSLYNSAVYRFPRNGVLHVLDQALSSLQKRKVEEVAVCSIGESVAVKRCKRPQRRLGRWQRKRDTTLIGVEGPR